MFRKEELWNQQLIENIKMDTKKTPSVSWTKTLITTCQTSLKRCEIANFVLLIYYTKTKFWDPWVFTYSDVLLISNHFSRWIQKQMIPHLKDWLLCSRFNFSPKLVIIIHQKIWLQVWTLNYLTWKSNQTVLYTKSWTTKLTWTVDLFENFQNAIF